MSFDKFGHIPEFNYITIDGTSGITLKYVNNKFLWLYETNTTIGSFNINRNTLTNVSESVHDHDVAILGYATEYAVNKSGDMMSGNVNMGGNFITNLQDPVNLQDAATKQYDNAHLTDPNDFLIKTGGTMLGNLVMGGSSVTDSANPVNNSDAVNEHHVDSCKLVSLFGQEKKEI